MYYAQNTVVLPHCACSHIWFHRIYDCEHPKLSACHTRPARTTSMMSNKDTRNKGETDETNEEQGRNSEATIASLTRVHACTVNRCKATMAGLSNLAAVFPEGCSHIIPLLKFQQRQVKQSRQQGSAFRIVMGRVL